MQQYTDFDNSCLFALQFSNGTPEAALKLSQHRELWRRSPSHQTLTSRNSCKSSRCRLYLWFLMAFATRNARFRHPSTPLTAANTHRPKQSGIDANALLQEMHGVSAFLPRPITGMISDVARFRDKQR